MKKRIPESELIISPDGSVYHLALRPEELASLVFVVGDPDRVSQVSKYFDSVEVKKQHREFLSETGYIGKKRITCLSTGIGTDNIDIVLNELDALVNIDFETRTIKDTLSSLDIIRLGTSGGIQADMEVDSFIASAFGIGLDGLLGYYDYTPKFSEWDYLLYPAIKDFGITPFITAANDVLLQKYASDIDKGVTITNTGFYGPQGRMVRAEVKNKNYIDMLCNIRMGNHRITNMEMETSAIYGLSEMLGHRALSINAIIANRSRGTFSKDPLAAVDKMIQNILSKI